MFILWSLLLGLGLAMDAFAISITNALKEDIKKKKMILIALTYGIFQGIMPLIGYLFSYSLKDFKWFVRIIPLIGFIILMILGFKMIIESKKEEEDDVKKLSIKVLFIQAIATTIDALSCGIGIDNTIDATRMYQVFIGIGIIVLVTFIICMIGLLIGKKLKGTFKNKSQIFGGIILIIISLKILIEFIVELF